MKGNGRALGAIGVFCSLVGVLANILFTQNWAAAAWALGSTGWAAAYWVVKYKQSIYGEIYQIRR